MLKSLIDHALKFLSDSNGDLSSKRLCALGCFIAAFVIALIVIIIKHEVDSGTVGAIATFAGSGTTILTTQAITKT